MTDFDTERIIVEAAEYMRTRFFGKYRGIVQDNDDPENLGRIRASVPEVYGEDLDSPWALPCVPFAGDSHGLVLLPEVGDGVWIEFEAGDISMPIWTGFWWGSNEIPNPGSTQARVLVTSDGHKLIMDEQESEIKLIHSSGAELTMTETEITLKIESNQIKLSSSGVNINDGSFEVR